MDDAFTRRRRRGSALLLQHLAEPSARPAAARRVASKLGEELASLLLLALAGDQRARGGRLGWRRG